MRFSLRHTRLLSRTMACVAGCLMFVSRVNGQDPAARGKNDLHLRIEVNQSSFHAGQPILLRLTLLNASGHPTTHESGSHTGLARIRVYDSNGKEIPMTGRPLGGRVGGAPHTLKASGELPVSKSGFPERVWLDLRDWGYELWTPGSYTLADPGLSSNRVKITVLERSPATDSAAIAQDYYRRRKEDVQQIHAGKARTGDTRAAVMARVDSIRAWKEARDSLHKE